MKIKIILTVFFSFFIMQNTFSDYDSEYKYIKHKSESQYEKDFGYFINKNLDIVIGKVENVERSDYSAGHFYMFLDFKNTFNYKNFKKYNKDIKTINIMYNKLFYPKKGDIFIAEADLSGKISTYDKSGKKSNFNIGLSDGPSYTENYFFVTCYDDKFYSRNGNLIKVLKKIELDLDLEYLEKYYFHRGLTLEKINGKLKKEIKTCKNFEKVFDVKLPEKLDYRFKEGYEEKANKISDLIEKKYLKKIEEIKEELGYNFEYYKFLEKKKKQTYDENEKIIIDVLSYYL